MAERARAERRALLRLRVWESLPRNMRRFYPAQRGLCMLCGIKLLLVSAGAVRKRDKGRATSWEHVTPRARAKGRTRNKTLTHLHCNGIKGARMPYACELLFLEFTNEIVEDLK